MIIIVRYIDVIPCWTCPSMESDYPDCLEDGFCSRFYCPVDELDLKDREVEFQIDKYKGSE